LIFFQEKSLQSAKKGNAANVTRDANEGTKDHSLLVYSSLLRNEILGAQIEDFKELSSVQDDRVKNNSGGANGQPNANSIPFSPTAAEQRNLYTFKARRLNIINEPTSPYSLTPVSAKSVKLLRSPRKASRKISKIPFKVLDAPELQDDFYLNLVDWSSQNVLSVGLGACVYLWSACTSQVTRLCDLTPDNDTVTSVSWSERVIFLDFLRLKK
jgi:cell division cycle 20-like protein 1 (cofactor of APC complex)